MDSDIKTIHLEEPIELNLILEDDNEYPEENIDLAFLKSVSVNYSDDDVCKLKPDYKKMSINKLREIAVEKLIPDASKLKKNDILKMLGDE
jgi:hypothetical protein